MRELVCIVCPAGCHITVADDGSITGYGCERGLDYAKSETTCPVRVLTSTVRIEGGLHGRLPVRTDKAIPKAKMKEAMVLLDGITVKSSVERGACIAAIPGTDACFIAARDM